MARKPLAGTVAANVLEHGTGALNVDACRIGGEWENPSAGQGAGRETANVNGPAFGNGLGGVVADAHPSGRWPANVLLDEQAAEMLDEQTGKVGANSTGEKTATYDHPQEGWGRIGVNREPFDYGDSGGASRFLYVAKASSAERNAGLDGFEERMPDNAVDRASQREGLEGANGRGSLSKPRANVHPTVKPIELMRWLVRLVTPPGGTVLDPFAGSGTTGCAAVLERLNFIGIEREAEYVAIARARVGWWEQHPEGLEIVKSLEADRVRRAVADSGQLGLLG